jgi:hypothetical protein
MAIGARARLRREASAKQRAPLLLKKRREIFKRAEEHVAARMRDRDAIKRWIGDCVTLPTAPLLALEELQKLRARGDAALSSTTPQVPPSPCALPRPESPPPPNHHHHHPDAPARTHAHAPASSPPQEPVAGLIPYRTDAYELPHWSTTCLLFQLFSLLGCSATRLGSGSGSG